MEFYNNQNIFIKFDPDTYTVTEVFNTGTQKRVSIITDRKIYIETKERNVKHYFTPITEIEFNNAYFGLINNL